MNSCYDCFWQWPLMLILPQWLLLWALFIYGGHFTPATSLFSFVLLSHTLLYWQRFCYIHDRWLIGTWRIIEWIGEWSKDHPELWFPQRKSERKSCATMHLFGSSHPFVLLFTCKVTAGLDHYSCSNVARMASGTLAGRKEQNLAWSFMNKGALNTVLTVFYDIIYPIVCCFLHPCC